MEIRLTCEAKDGVLTITDHTNGQTYTGTYKTAGTSPKSVTYEITLDRADGMAVVAMTNYHDGTQTPTLVMSVGEWAICFTHSFNRYPINDRRLSPLRPDIVLLRQHFTNRLALRCIDPHIAF